jgi:hypothetical protein
MSTEVSAEERPLVCQFCGGQADHTCGVMGIAHYSCGDCCSMLGMLANNVRVYKWVTKNFDRLNQCLEESRSERRAAIEGACGSQRQKATRR